MSEDNDSPRPGFGWFVSHKGQGKYFDTEWNVDGERCETPKGYYTSRRPTAARGSRSAMPLDEGIKSDLPDQKVR